MDTPQAARTEPDITIQQANEGEAAPETQTVSE